MDLRQSQLGSALLLAGLLGACSSADASGMNEGTRSGVSKDPTSDPGDPVQPQGFELLNSDVKRQDPQLSGATEANLAAGNRDFALDLYAQLRTKDGNLFFSPYSISTALAMAYVGARGETKSEMAAALHFDLPDAELHAAFNALMRTLEERNVPSTADLPGVQFESHNDVWAHSHPEWRPKQSFVDSLALDYASRVKIVDFFQPELARTTINAEVKRLTHGAVIELIPENVITGDTAMVLTNTVYLEAGWAFPFAEELTRNAPFSTPAGEQTVDMMHGTSYVHYVANDDLQAVRLPYRGEELGLWVLLPKKERFAAVEASLDGEQFEALRDSAERKFVEVKLPKVKMRTNAGLKNPLRALGMETAFALGRADFDIVPRPVFIADVVHEAFIDLDEAGTEAGAATAVVFEGDSAEPEPEAEFTADRPFILLLEDRATQSILFAGRVVSPQ